MINDLGRVPLAPGSREPDQQAVPALTGFDPSRYEGKPRHLGKQNRKILSSYVEPMFARIAGLNPKDLQALVFACRNVSPINCGWQLYEIAKLLHDVASYDLEAREAASAMSARSGETAGLAPQDASATAESRDAHTGPSS